MSPRECDLIATKVQFCGRMIYAKGVTFHPHPYEALTSMEAPTHVGALMEFVHGANWMRTAIPRFSEVIEPLHNLLEAQYSLRNSRKKSRVCNRPLSAWGDEHQGWLSHSLVPGDHPAIDLLRRTCKRFALHRRIITLGLAF